MLDFSRPVRCPHLGTVHSFTIEGKRYMLTPCRDFKQKRHEVQRATVHEMDIIPGRFPRFWEISEPLIRGPRSAHGSINVAFHLEFPDASKKDEAVSLVEAMLSTRALQWVQPLVAHSCR